MKLCHNFFGKFLVALLTLVSLGGNFTYGFSFTEVRQRTEDQKDNIKSTRSLVLTFQDNEYRDFQEPSEDFLFDFIPFAYSTHVTAEETTHTSVYNYYDRDLKAVLTAQIFPSHFFL